VPGSNWYTSEGDKNVSNLEGLFEEDFETQWTIEDIQRVRSSAPVAKRLAERLTKRLKREFGEEIGSAYLAFSGIKAGYFVPIAAVGREIENILEISQFSVNCLISKIIVEDPKVIDHLVEEPHIAHADTYASKIPCKQKFTIFLREHGELFGIFSINSPKDRNFTPGFISSIRAIHPRLNQTFAEVSFSERLWNISTNSPNFTGEEHEDEILNGLLEVTLCCFAASGAIIRIWDQGESKLDLKYSAVARDPESLQIVTSKLSSPGSAGERVSRSVFEATTDTWIVATNYDSKIKVAGAEYCQSDVNELFDMGISSFFVFPLVESGHKRAGTLSVFHTFSRLYSWRDLALATIAGQKVVDAITLIKKQNELSDKNTDLQIANTNLEQEHGLVTGAEVASLLSHEVGHRLFSIKNTFEELEDTVKSAMRKQLVFDAVKPALSELETSIEAAQRTMATINSVFTSYNNAIESNSSFSVTRTIQEVFDTLSDALSRNRIDIDVTGSEKVMLKGNQQILGLVVFNLLVNSIQAQRNQRSPKKNTVHVRIREMSGEKSRPAVVAVDFWDEGPGINRTHFPNADDIFLLGSSSKGGTGRGLAVSRNMLNVFFAADINLVDPKTAFFRLTFRQ
jgi:signal transduction histidine kinase